MSVNRVFTSGGPAHRGHAHFETDLPPDPLPNAAPAETWEPVPFEIHHRGDCPLDCPWCHCGGES